MLIFNYNQIDVLNFSLVIVLFINCVFLIYYMLNGIVNEKEYDLYIGYVLTFFLIIATCTYEFAFHYYAEDISFTKLIRLVICFTACPISIYLIIKIADEISWTEFKIVGASEFFQYIYRQAGFYITLLKVDYQLSMFALVLEFRQGPFHINSYSAILISIGIPLLFAFSIIGYKALRLESCKLIIIFLASQIIMPLFIAYQVYQIYISAYEKKSNDYIIIYASMFIDAMCLITKGILIFETNFVRRNFNQGLKERAFALECDQEMQPLLYKVRRRKLKISNCC